MREAVKAWRRGTRPLVQLGVLLAVLGTLWVAASALLFTLFAKTPLRGPIEFLRYAMVEQGDLLFTCGPSSAGSAWRSSLR